MDVHDITGNVVTCSTSSIRLWTINGNLLAFHRLPPQSNEVIQCCSLYKGADSVLTHEAVLVTGHKDGTLRVWFMDSDAPWSRTPNFSRTTSPEETVDMDRLPVSLLLVHVLVSGYASPVTSLLVSGVLPSSLAIPGSLSGSGSSTTGAGNAVIYSGDAAGMLLMWAEPDVVYRAQRKPSNLFLKGIQGISQGIQTAVAVPNAAVSLINNM